MSEMNVHVDRIVRVSYGTAAPKMSAQERELINGVTKANSCFTNYCQTPGPVERRAEVTPQGVKSAEEKKAANVWAKR